MSLPESGTDYLFRQAVYGLLAASAAKKAVCPQAHNSPAFKPTTHQPESGTDYLFRPSAYGRLQPPQRKRLSVPKPTVPQAH